MVQWGYMLCRTCKSKDNLYISHTYNTKKYGTRNVYICRACNTAKKKRYRQTENGKVATKKAVTKYEKANRHKRKAWTLAKEIGLQKCQVCATTTNIQRHHYDYGKPLDVVFLCVAHHNEVHKIIEV